MAKTKLERIEELKKRKLELENQEKSYCNSTKQRNARSGIDGCTNVPPYWRACCLKQSNYQASSL